MAHWADSFLPPSSLPLPSLFHSLSLSLFYFRLLRFYVPYVPFLASLSFELVVVGRAACTPCAPIAPTLSVQ
jgi:hypothetical protein